MRAHACFAGDAPLPPLPRPRPRCHWLPLVLLSVVRFSRRLMHAHNLSAILSPRRSTCSSDIFIARSDMLVLQQQHNPAAPTNNSVRQTLLWLRLWRRIFLSLSHKQRALDHQWSRWQSPHTGDAQTQNLSKRHCQDNVIGGQFLASLAVKCQCVLSHAVGFGAATRFSPQPGHRAGIRCKVGYSAAEARAHKRTTNHTAGCEQNTSSYQVLGESSGQFRNPN